MVGGSCASVGTLSVLVSCMFSIGVVASVLNSIRRTRGLARWVRTR